MNGTATAAPTPTASKKGTPDHDARGRFAEGNRGGPGNPFARQAAAFRAALCRAVTPGAFDRIAAALVAEAEEGNVSAIRLLLSYLLGKPQPAPAAETDGTPSPNGDNGGPLPNGVAAPRSWTGRWPRSP